MIKFEGLTDRIKNYVRMIKKLDNKEQAILNDISQSIKENGIQSLDGQLKETTNFEGADSFILYEALKENLQSDIQILDSLIEKISDSNNTEIKARELSDTLDDECAIILEELIEVSIEENNENFKEIIDKGAIVLNKERFKNIVQEEREVLKTALKELNTKAYK